MKVAILTTDNREHYRKYSEDAPRFGTAPEALIQGFASFPGEEIHVLSCTKQSMTGPEKLAPNVWFHSIRVGKMGWMKTGYQGCVRAVRKKLREIVPDIVHGQGTERDCALNAVFSGYPSVLTIHGNMRLLAKMQKSRMFSYQWLTAISETLTVPRAAGVVCISRYTEQAMTGLAKKTWLLPNAVDGSFFDVRPQARAEMPPLILCVGFICQRKNQNAFIRALDPLATKHKFRLVFLGDHNKNEAYSAEFMELLRSRPWCEHHGFVNREGLKAWLGKANVLALPSLEDNCPMTVLEAAAAGVPVVAANVGGVPDLVEDGRTGLFCNPQDATSMCNAVDKVLTMPEFSRSLSEAARRSALERFHPRVIAGRHLEIYREVLGGLKRRS